MIAQDWYWIVAADTTQVYSSKTNTYVPSDDPTYTAAKGNGCPSSIANEQELWEVMQANAPGFLPLWLYDGTTFSQTAVDVYSKAQLAAYSADARWRKETGGAVCAGTPLRTDRVSQSQRDATYSFFQLVPGATVQWKLPDGGFMPLDKTTLEDQMKDTAGYVQDCFTCEQQTLDGITAGTTTTLAQIDAAYAAISTDR